MTNVQLEQTLHTGMHFKKGSGLGYPFGCRNWKPRFFELTQSTLEYFDFQGSEWKGEVDLRTKHEDTGELLASIEVMPVDSKKTGKSASTIWRIAVNNQRPALAALGEHRAGDESLSRQAQARAAHETRLPRRARRQSALREPL